MNNPFIHMPPQARPPLHHVKHETSKTHFFQKWKKQEESFINMNRSMAQKGTPLIKVGKKFSFELKQNHQKNQPLIRSLKTLSREKTVPKSKSTNLIVKDEPDTRVRKNTRKVPKNKADQQIKTYHWRTTTHFPLMKVSCTGSKDLTQKFALGQAWQELDLQIPWTEDIKFQLHEINQFSLLNSLYIIEESLVSFERLFNKFGFFQPTLKMIFITNSFKCKIWANENVWQNTPLPPKFVSKQHQKVEYFYKKVIKMFSKYFQYNTQNQEHQSVRKSVNLIEKLMYELERKTDFVQGMKFINEFLTAYSLKINNKFIIPIQIADTRSRIFSKLQKSRPTKITTLPDIPLKVQQQEKLEKNIKTLKNSYHKCSKQVLESNVRTIIDRKTPPKEKQIPFKKKSQISICSKQTIVEKKSRFSLHEEKQPNHLTSNPMNSRHLPNFTNEDFNEQQNQAIINEQQSANQDSNYRREELTSDPINDEEEYEEIIRNQIEKNVRQKNGWLQSPLLLFDGDDCAKSFQDSQPSIKMKIRQRNLSKLNRIKSSVAQSIVE